MLTLGIETSCDETAAAVVEDGRRCLSNVIHSQVPIHARSGGVVPELASRNHLLAIVPVIDDALAQAGVSLSAIDQIAVTVGPGLVGALMVGLETAKGLAYVHNIPLIGVNHLEGHVLSPWVDDDCSEGLGFPYLATIVSGGHTSLVLARGPGDYRTLGRTRDDAAGEAFDKVAKRLGEGYPGGPFIDRAAGAGDPNRFPLPSPMLGRGLDFSFSGLKTAAATLIGRLEEEAEGGGQSRADWLPHVCASVQQAVVRVLVSKSIKAIRRTRVRRWVVAGGVACNSALRSQAATAADRNGVQLFIPEGSLCTDNAAMIAAAGALRERPRGSVRDALGLDVSANLALDR